MHNASGFTECAEPKLLKDDTGELGYLGPLYAGLLAMTSDLHVSAMTDNMLGPSPMHIKYVYWTMCIPNSVCEN